MKTHVQKTNRPAEKSSTSFARKNTAVGPASAFAQETEALDETSARHGTPRGHDFSRTPVFSKTPVRLQTKLTINVPGDIYEQEADRVAQQIMRMPESQGQVLGDRQVQAKFLQADGREGFEAPPIVGEVLHSPGQPLEASTRAFMEPYFGHDFGGVRVHADAKAMESARAVSAVAYTAGRHMVFDASRYEPSTGNSRRLLAHELAHVVQQDGSPVSQRGSALGIQRQMAKSINKDVTNKSKNKVALVAALKARITVLLQQEAKLSQAYETEKSARWGPRSAGTKQIHQALAFLFLKHHPGARIKSMNAEVVGIDTRDLPEWNKTQPGETISRGAYLAKFPGYKNFFITGPETLWITWAGVKANPDSYREFLSRSADIPEHELEELLDPGYKQALHSAGKWITSWDDAPSREAPLLIQIIADLNPLMAVAKIISLIKDKKPLYAMPGTKATAADVFEAVVGLFGEGASLLGKLKTASKLAKAGGTALAKSLNPLSTVIEKAAKSLSKDEEVQEIIAKIIEVTLDDIDKKHVLNPIKGSAIDFLEERSEVNSGKKENHQR